MYRESHRHNNGDSSAFVSLPQSAWTPNHNKSKATTKTKKNIFPELQEKAEQWRQQQYPPSSHKYVAFISSASSASSAYSTTSTSRKAVQPTQLQYISASIPDRINHLDHCLLLRQSLPQPPTAPPCTKCRWLRKKKGIFFLLSSSPTHFFEQSRRSQPFPILHIYKLPFSPSHIFSDIYWPKASGTSKSNSKKNNDSRGGGRWIPLSSLQLA